MQYGKRQDRNKVLPRIFKVCFSILQSASPEAGISDGVQGEGDQEGASTPAESVRCFMQCASGALAARDDSFSSKALALSRAAGAAHARGLVDADEVMQACHLASCPAGGPEGRPPGVPAH